MVLWIFLSSRIYYFIKFLSLLSFKKYFLFLSFSLSVFSSFFLFPSYFFFLSLIYSLLRRSVLDLHRRSVLGSSSSSSHAADPSHPVLHLTTDPLAWLLRYPSCLASLVSQSTPTHSPAWPSMGPTYFTVPILLGSFAEWTCWPTRNSRLDSIKSSCIFFFFFLLQ